VDFNERGIVFSFMIINSNGYRRRRIVHTMEEERSHESHCNPGQDLN
jgi:hypothetical protein